MALEVSSGFLGFLSLLKTVLHDRFERRVVRIYLEDKYLEVGLGG